MNMRTIPLIKLQNFRKRKYTSYTIAHLTVFTCAFCHICVENLLKVPDIETGEDMLILKSKVM